MEKISVIGGKRLHGSITVGGMKNAALPILLGTILVGDKCVIENLPEISDIKSSLDILSSLGATVKMLDRTTVTAVGVVTLLAEEDHLFTNIRQHIAQLLRRIVVLPFLKAVLITLHAPGHISIHLVHQVIGDTVDFLKCEGILRKEVAALIVHLNGRGLKLQKAQCHTVLLELETGTVPVEDGFFSVGCIARNQASRGDLCLDDAFVVIDLHSPAPDAVESADQIGHSKLPLTHILSLRYHILPKDSIK